MAWIVIGTIWPTLSDDVVSAGAEVVVIWSDMLVLKTPQMESKIARGKPSDGFQVD